MGLLPRLREQDKAETAAGHDPSAFSTVLPQMQSRKPDRCEEFQDPSGWRIVHRQGITQEESGRKIEQLYIEYKKRKSDA